MSEENEKIFKTMLLSLIEDYNIVLPKNNTLFKTNKNINDFEFKEVLEFIRELINKTSSTILNTSNINKEELINLLDIFHSNIRLHKVDQSDKFYKLFGGKEKFVNREIKINIIESFTDELTDIALIHNDYIFRNNIFENNIGATKIKDKFKERESLEIRNYASDKKYEGLLAVAGIEAVIEKCADDLYNETINNYTLKELGFTHAEINEYFIKEQEINTLQVLKSFNGYYGVNLNYNNLVLNKSQAKNPYSAALGVPSHVIDVIDEDLLAADSRGLISHELFHKMERLYTEIKYKENELIKGKYLIGQYFRDNSIQAKVVQDDKHLLYLENYNNINITKEKRHEDLLEVVDLLLKNRYKESAIKRNKIKNKIVGGLKEREYDNVISEIEKLLLNNTDKNICTDKKSDVLNDLKQYISSDFKVKSLLTIIGEVGDINTYERNVLLKRAEFEKDLKAGLNPNKNDEKYVAAEDVYWAGNWEMQARVARYIIDDDVKDIGNFIPKNELEEYKKKNIESVKVMKESLIDYILKTPNINSKNKERLRMFGLDVNKVRLDATKSANNTTQGIKELGDIGLKSVNEEIGVGDRFKGLRGANNRMKKLRGQEDSFNPPIAKNIR